MTHDVFVSYSTKDKIVADTIVAFLEKNNIRCWYAPRDIKPGADWGEAIAQAAGECKIFLLVFSSSANRSQRVLDELNLAITKEAVILPFRIEKLDPSGAMLLHLSSRHWLDAYSPSWQEHLTSLQKSITSILEGGVPAAGKDGLSTVKQVDKKKTGRRWWVFGSLGIVLSLALALGLPGLINTKTNLTPPPSATATESAQQTPTLQTPQVGTKDNPLIWMYVPSPFFEFNEISKAADEVMAQFHEAYPDLYLKAIPAPDNETIIDALCDGEAQVGSLPAISYLVASERGCANGVLLWSAYEDIKYGGMIVSSAENDFSSMEDLKGKILCIPSLTSLSGYVLPSLEIRAKIGKPEGFFAEIREVGSHSEVIKQVYQRNCDSGTTYYDARLDSGIADAAEKISILGTTPPIPNQNLSFTEAIPAELSQKLIDFFLSSSIESGNLALVCQIDISKTETRLVEINDYYYNQIRDLFLLAEENPVDYLYTGQ